MRHPLLLGAPLALAACTVGPNYAGPPRAASADAPNHFVRGGDVANADAPAVGQWWTALGDTTLDALETRALAANPDIAVAQARLHQARAALQLERGNQLPNVSAQATYLHAKLPGINLGQSSGSAGAGDGQSSDAGQSSGGGSTSLNFYNVGFDASWEADLFGGQRRTVEAQRAQVAAAEANVADAQVSLSAEIAQNYVNLRDRQQRIALSERSSAMQRQMLALTRQRFARGTASALDVERLRGQVESTDAERLPLGAEVEGYLNALAVLTGVEPGAVDAMLKAPAPVPLPPASVAVGDSAALLQRRPDIRAAERTIAAQTARIGIAESARFPRINLLGIIGLGGSRLSDLTDLGNLSAIAAPMLQWSFLDFGRNAARVRQAEGVREEAEARYRSTVLGALRDAENALSRFGNRRSTVASIARAKASADRAAALMQQRYRAGTATLIDTLDAERQRVAAEQNLSAATAGLTTDFVALQKALGLGWQAS